MMQSNKDIIMKSPSDVRTMGGHRN